MTEAYTPSHETPEPHRNMPAERVGTALRNLVKRHTVAYGEIAEETYDALKAVDAAFTNEKAREVFRAHIAPTVYNISRVTSGVAWLADTGLLAAFAIPFPRDVARLNQQYQGLPAGTGWREKLWDRMANDHRLRVSMEAGGFVATALLQPYKSMAIANSYLMGGIGSEIAKRL